MSEVETSPEVAAVLAEPDEDAALDRQTVNLTDDDALSLRVEPTDEYDKYLVQAARELYRTNRKDWRRFCDEHPELATLQARVSGLRSRDSMIGKDNRIHTTNEVVPGSPEGYEPYKCWSHDVDKHRWYRNRGTEPEGHRSEDDDADARDLDSQLPMGEFADAPDRPGWVGGSLLGLHLATNGGYHVSRFDKASRPAQLEVCRLCGTKLDLPTDDEGNIDRDRGGQLQYCSDRCRRDVENARDRAGRRANKSPTKRQRREALKRKSDIDIVRIAGLGEISLSPAEWNRLTPRRNEPVREWTPWTRPRPNGPAVNAVCATRGKRPESPPRTLRESADVVARRWHAYGAGGRTAPTPRIWVDGWDEVVFRYDSQKVPE